MNADEPSAAQVIADAKARAIAICLSQLGDNNDIGNMELLTLLDEIGDDAQAIYALLRILTATITTLATASVDESRAGQAIELVVRQLDLTAR